MRTNSKRRAVVVPDETPVQVVEQRRLLARYLPMWPSRGRGVRQGSRGARHIQRLLELDAWGVVDELDAFVRVERGVLIRLASVLPRGVKRAAAFGANLFEILREAVRRAQTFVVAGDQVPAHSGMLEEMLRAQLQYLMDKLVESEKELDSYALESLAGLGGCDLGSLRRFRASSGIEAAYQVAWCVHRAVRAGDSMFFFGPRRQVGRRMPASPQDMESDDSAILRAVLTGKRLAKHVADAVAELTGETCSAGHVSKRKMDLTRWDLLAKVRQCVLTDKGRQWVRELSPPPLGSRST